MNISVLVLKCGWCGATRQLRDNTHKPPSLCSSLNRERKKRNMPFDKGVETVGQGALLSIQRYEGELLSI